KVTVFLFITTRHDAGAIEVVVAISPKILIRQALSHLFDIVMPNRINLVELTMTQPNQTQYHLELILAIYNLIPY
ncbi:hypothetical protein CGH01_25370, partial [Vibrio parahaemolyticus]